MKRSRNFLVALSKLKHYDGIVWCGCITPSEALALMEYGAKPEGHYGIDMMYYFAHGISNPCWFYFIPYGDLCDYIANTQKQKQKQKQK